MAEDLSTQRPTIVDKQYQKYQSTPKYVKHEWHEDKLAILVCLIRIWQSHKVDWFTIPDDCLCIRECASIEITDSTKDLIGKAVVKFPRGTVLNIKRKEDSEVYIGDTEDQTDAKATIDEATNNGEVIASMAAQYSDDGVSTTSMAINYSQKGLIDFNRSKEEAALLSPNDVAIGNRIEIRLGYAYSEEEFDKMNSSDGSDMECAFTGFITSISADTPLELECANMAYVFTTISAPNITAKANVTVKEFLDEDDNGYHMLRDTGIELTESSQKQEISVFGGTITDNLTVADVLEAWNDSGVMCMMVTDDKGVSKLKVGLNCYTGLGGNALPNNDKKYITYNEGNDSVIIIQADWDIAQDKLGLKQCDKNFIAIEAKGKTSDKQFFKLTVRKNPDVDSDEWLYQDGDTWQVVNKHEVKDKKKAKNVDGTTRTKTVSTKRTNPANMKKYTTIQYISTKVGITEAELIEEAKQFWSRYVPTGISGSIDIFGDLPVKPSNIVGLVDPRHPEKNGYYFVEAVNTSFGLSGYRKDLTIPFKISSFAQPIKIIE